MTDDSRLLHQIAPSQQENLDALAQRELPTEIAEATLRAAEEHAWDRLLNGGVWERRSVDDLRSARAAVTAAIEARVRQAQSRRDLSLRLLVANEIERALAGDPTVDLHGAIAALRYVSTEEPSFSDMAALVAFANEHPEWMAGSRGATS